MNSASAHRCYKVSALANWATRAFHLRVCHHRCDEQRWRV